MLARRSGSSRSFSVFVSRTGHQTAPGSAGERRAEKSRISSDPMCAFEPPSGFGPIANTPVFSWSAWSSTELETLRASIPIARVVRNRSSPLSDGDLVLLVGSGAGMNWAIDLLGWQNLDSVESSISPAAVLDEGPAIDRLPHRNGDRHGLISGRIEREESLTRTRNTSCPVASAMPLVPST
jgi:hypothetical protein